MRPPCLVHPRPKPCRQQGGDTAGAPHCGAGLQASSVGFKTSEIPTAQQLWLSHRPRARVLFCSSALGTPSGAVKPWRRLCVFPPRALRTICRLQSLRQRGHSSAQWPCMQGPGEGVWTPQGGRPPKSPVTSLQRCLSQPMLGLGVPLSGPCSWAPEVTVCSGFISEEVRPVARATRAMEGRNTGEGKNPCFHRLIPRHYAHLAGEDTQGSKSLTSKSFSSLLKYTSACLPSWHKGTQE